MDLDLFLLKRCAPAPITIRRLRLEVTGLDQDSFAKMCKLTTKTLSTLENDRGNPTINTLNGILRPFGLAMTLGSLRHRPAKPVRQNEQEPARKRGASPKRQKAALQTTAAKAE